MNEMAKLVNERCSIARSLAVLGQKWTILILREAILRDATRFSHFRDALGIAPDILSDRLGQLVEAGILERHPYQDSGERQRVEYVLTDSGRDLKPVLAAISAWGDAHRPSGFGPAAVYTDLRNGAPVSIAFLDSTGQEIDPSQVAALPGPGSSAVA